MIVHRIATGSNVYLLEGAETLVMVDAGYPHRERKILAALAALAPKRLSLIFITHGHFDHYGNAGAIRDATAAPIAIHPLDRVAMARGETPIPKRKGWGHLGPPLLAVAEWVYAPLRTEADLTLDDGDRLDRFGIDAVVIHTPGHTRGSCSLLVEKRLLFVGDLIIARPWIHKQSYYAEDWQAIDESIARVKALSPERIYPGHGSRALSREKLMRMKGL